MSDFILRNEWETNDQRHCLISVEGLKAVEMEKCKNEISYIKDQLWNAQKKYVDFNFVRCVVVPRIQANSSKRTQRA